MSLPPALGKALPQVLVIIFSRRGRLGSVFRKYMVFLSRKGGREAINFRKVSDSFIELDYVAWDYEFFSSSSEKLELGSLSLTKYTLNNIIFT